MMVGKVMRSKLLYACISILVLMFPMVFFEYVAPRVAFAAVPARVMLLSPSNGATGLSTAPTLSWAAVPGATSYQVEIFRIEGNVTTYVLRQLTAQTFLLVRRPFLTSPERRDLPPEVTYTWRVRAINSSGMGEGSTQSTFTTSTRNVWSPVNTVVNVHHRHDLGLDAKVVTKTWDQAAVTWYDREQSWLFWPVAKELAWEHEFRAPKLSSFWSAVVGSSFDSNIPWGSFGWETGEGEVAFRTGDPGQLVAGTTYTSRIFFHPASSRPITLSTTIKSELEDWRVGWQFARAWDDLRGTMIIPGERQFQH